MYAHMHGQVCTNAKISRTPGHLRPQDRHQHGLSLVHFGLLAGSDTEEHTFHCICRRLLDAHFLSADRVQGAQMSMPCQWLSSELSQSPAEDALSSGGVW